MWLKNGPYWLKGGIIAIILEIMIITIAYVNGSIKTRVAECLIPPCPLLYQFFNLSGDIRQFIIFLLLVSIVLFFIGTVIGLIVDKLKK